MFVAIKNETPRFKIHPRKFTSFIKAILAALGYRNTFLSVVFVSSRSIKRLNRKYLNHSWATDVLAFPFENSKGVKNGVRERSFLGEVIISPEQARSNAKRFGVSFVEELARYVCHGILHLKGYSDRSVRLRNKMRRAEDKLLKLLHSKVEGIV